MTTALRGGNYEAAMRLVSVYETPGAEHFLWDLLVDRPEVANISHKQMPSWQQHAAFIASNPYAFWYLIELPIEITEVGYTYRHIGAIYLTRKDEIGLGIMEHWQHQGHGAAAVQHLKALHPRPRYFAHVAPANLQGQQFWLKQGFKPLQVTYELA